MEGAYRSDISKAHLLTKTMLHMESSEGWQLIKPILEMSIPDHSHRLDSSATGEQSELSASAQLHI